ncbi:MAG: DUF86 domain-containing protein [Thermodesulfobacteriota bacterium]|nr:DUF86 domain-containing protein [Thermodesulfobacteriota bacterium]
MRNVSGLNRDKVLRLLGILDEALAELVNIRRIEKADVLSSRDRFALEDLFYRLGMAAIDICFHVAAKSGGKVPGTYKDCFAELVSLGFLDPALADKLKELAGLRNVIAHMYWDVDYSQLYDFLSDLECVQDFRGMVLKLLDNR